MIDFYQALKDKPHLKLQIRADEAIDGLLIRILNKTTGMGLNTGFTQEEMKQSRSLRG
jgi:hypothetical protein